MMNVIVKFTLLVYLQSSPVCAFYHSISTQSLAFILNFPFEASGKVEPGSTTSSKRISMSSEVKLNRRNFIFSSE